MKNRIIESLILALGLTAMGFFIQSGIHSFSLRDRVVTVKGLAEAEFPADKVIWPIVYKEAGNNLLALYDNLHSKNEIVISFLQSNGIETDEITISAPVVYDMQAERYSTNTAVYRYNITSVITISSDKVDLIRKLMSQQASLLQKGIAVTSDYQYNTEFIFTRLNEVKPQMIEEATKNAREAAIKFAEDSDSKLGKIKRAYQGQFSITNRDENTPHIKNIRVVTTIEYYLKD
ncbi:MAG: SIMPL domain-containing protein [Bacteroidales bacterium]|jgi:hypothetical protein|nr:SIMPL domain-containing protein [Bacteroidales bacterium]MCK9448303.1 SIMPL domain-containing protein [Bacteroidales bacterium]MDD3701695.1 SIMPL domain-containing protein [Bacteroidales bacterium]MDY0369908.1 SIMPL domain-containing protein [Bacteroidales bacterium]